MDRINFGLIRRAAIAIGEQVGMTDDDFASLVARRIVAENPGLDFGVYKAATLYDIGSGGETPEAEAALKREMARAEAEFQAQESTLIRLKEFYKTA